MRFEGRDLKTYAEPVDANLLVEGECYFTIQYADDRMLNPLISTWVFLGRRLDPDDVDEILYFQDVDSYQQGIRYGAPVAEGARFHVYTQNEIKFFFEFERALEQLMKCSLRRHGVSNHGSSNT
jgi:hypothetical protein